MTKIRAINKRAVICTQDFRELSGEVIIEMIRESCNLESEEECLEGEFNRSGRHKSKTLMYR